jgi:hypothetical protein
MKKFSILILLFSTFIWSQRIVKTEIPANKPIELREDRFYIDNVQYPSYQIKDYLEKADYSAYNLFARSRNKSNWGGFLLGFGSALVVSDVVRSAVSDAPYPSAFTYLGAASLLVSYPVLKGKSKLLQQSIDTYNGNLKNKADLEINFGANTDGVGLVITF